MKFRNLSALSAALMIALTGCASSANPDETVLTDANVTSEVTSEMTEKTTAAETTTAEETTSAETTAEETTLAETDVEEITAPAIPVDMGDTAKAIALANYPDAPDGWHEYSIDPEFVAMMNSFADRVSDKLISSATENISVSPASMFTAMSVLARSADGNSEKEIYTLLTGSAPTEKTDIFIGSGCGRFMRLLNLQSHGAAKMANSLWLTDVYDFNKDFLSDTARDYYAESYSANFSGNPLGVGSEMSRWVSDNTNNMLNPEFEPDVSTVMCIINTIYLNSEWLEIFPERLTAKDDFTMSDGSTVQCDFMKSTFSSQFLKGKNFSSAYVPTKEVGLKMHFILPDNGVSTSDLLANGDIFSEVLSAERKEVEISYVIPKFSFDTEADLIDTFKAMGVNSCFVPSGDFAELCSSTNEIYVSDIKHGSKVSIDEKGLEAAAFTHIATQDNAIVLQTEHIDFLLDRPFLFMIEFYGNILFTGVVNNPAAE